MLAPLGYLGPEAHYEALKHRAGTKTGPQIYPQTPNCLNPRLTGLRRISRCIKANVGLVGSAGQGVYMSRPLKSVLRPAATIRHMTITSTCVALSPETAAGASPDALSQQCAHSLQYQRLPCSVAASHRPPKFEASKPPSRHFAQSSASPTCPCKISGMLAIVLALPLALLS